MVGEVVQKVPPLFSPAKKACDPTFTPSHKKSEKRQETRPMCVDLGVLTYVCRTTKAVANSLVHITSSEL